VPEVWVSNASPVIVLAKVGRLDRLTNRSDELLLPEVVRTNGGTPISSLTKSPLEQTDIRVYQDRVGNWVQKFRTRDEGLLFATAQFGRYREIERFLEEHLASESARRTQLLGRPKS